MGCTWNVIFSYWCADGRPMLAGEEDALGTADGKRQPLSHQQRQTAGARPLPHAMPPDWDQARPAAPGEPPSGI